MRLRRTICAALAVILTACSDGTGPDGNGGDSFGSVFVLNSVGRTIARFDIEDDRLEVAASPVVLPANFDGDALDVRGERFATTVSSFGGSQVILGSLRTGELTVVTFPGAQGAEANPGKVTLVDDPVRGLQAWVGGRGTDAVYRIDPDAGEATVVAAEVGEFIERVLPLDTLVAAVDANLDDEGGTFQPLGPPRIVTLDRDLGTAHFTIEMPEAVGATDAIFDQGELFVLAGGSFSQDASGSFVPDANGHLVIAGMEIRQVRESIPLGGNGLTMSAGGDGNLYIARSSDLESTDLVAYNVFEDRWAHPPEDPLEPEDAQGGRIDCWVARSMTDGRILCATFSTDPQDPGRLYLLDSAGRELSSVESGAGSTDIVVR